MLALSHAVRLYGAATSSRSVFAQNRLELFVLRSHTLGNTFNKSINSKQYPENTGRNAYDNEA
jgi:hypothetical protein